MEFSKVEQCKTWEEEIYWKCFHAMHFYLVLPKDFHHHLVLPSKFAVHVSSKLPNKVSLIGPSRCTWDVEVSKTGSLALVGDGWKDFAKAYDLEENFLMLFKYKQNSSFEVLIFDQKSMCEKEFSYFVKKPFPKPNCRIDEKRKVVKAVIMETVEDNDGGGGGGFESVLSRNSKKGASVNGDKNNPEAPKASPLDESSKDDYNDLDFVASDKARDDIILEKMKVLSESDQSKKWEEEMYWEHFNAMHFYQVLPKDFHVHLVLPSKFAEHMSSKLPNKVSLTGPTGATWEITVSKNGSLALVGDEWKDFVKTYNLEENLLMIFKYKQNSSFEVLIFNQNNLCEKESSYFVKKCLSESGYGINRKSSLVEAATTELMEDYDSDNDGGSECVLSKKSKKEVSDEEQRITPEVPRTCSSDELTDDNHNDPGFVVANNALDIIVETVGSGDRKNHHGLKSCVSNEVAAQDKGGINEAAKSKFQSETVHGDHSPEMNHSRSSCTEKGRQVKRVLPKSSKKPVLDSGTKRVAEEYMSNRRPVTNEEKEDTVRQAAEAFTKGSFIAVMCPTSVYKRFYLTISADWVHKILPRRHQQVILRVGEKTWVTMFHWYSSMGLGGLQAGWKNFAIENNLEDFDVCLFKLATVKDDATPIFDVKIFRVVQETTPLTPVICSL